MFQHHSRRRRLTTATLGALLVAPLALPTAAAAADEAPAGPGAPLVTTESTWSYLDDNTEPHGDLPDVLAWTAPEFDDAAWKTARGSFGALRGAIGELSGGVTPHTLLNQYVDGKDAPNIPTFFLRTEFDLDAVSLDRLESLDGTLVFDDAVRVYLNGELVFNDLDERATDTATNLQFAGMSGGSPASRSFSLDVASLPAGTLVAGTNTLAVTLYQDRPTSSDLYLDFASLVPVLGEAPVAPRDDEQAIRVEVPQVDRGEFVWSIDRANSLVDLGVAEVSGDRFEARGSINPVRVTDTRLGAPAWSIAGQVSDFVAGGATIEAKNLGWTPSVTENEGGATAGAAVVSGFLGGEGLGTSSVLGSAETAHALGSSLLGADLELLLPLTVDEGTYSATLTLTALS